jgi:exonuclease SbcC
MVSVGMRSNLLILDEPTDGFSKEQLGNVREVLDEVGSPQVIIVSHDKELESFADQIFRVEKTGSESTVSTPK